MKKINITIRLILFFAIFFNFFALSFTIPFLHSACAFDYSFPDVGLPGEFLSDDQPIKEILESFLEWILLIIGTVAVISFIIAGLQYMLASGDEEVLKNAKRHLQYSIIGIIIALSGFVIIQAIDALLNANSNV